MNQPILSHLQFAVLDSLGAERVKGSELRERLRSQGFLKTSPAFYQLMARLEDADFVTGDTEVTPVAGYGLKERFYRITGEGEKALRNTYDFYQSSATATGLRGAFGH